mmetsp:Transcript_17122/g.56761  ORF Transcript_17122/g.56761 Transcript_17122/m.56761 type:complete len:760 (-) Transcript_17122:1191-3470(-)
MKTPRANELSQDRDNQGPEKKRQDVKQASTPRSKTGSEEILNSGISAEAQDSRTQRSPWMNEMEGVHTGMEGVQSEMEGEQQERRNEEIRDVQGEIKDVQGGIGDVQGKIGDVQGGIGGVQGGIGDVQGKIEGVQGEIKDVQGEIKGVQGKIEGVQGKIEGVQGEIKDVQKEITDLLKRMQGQNDPTQEEILKQLIKRETQLVEDKTQLVKDKTQLVEYQQLLVEDKTRLVEDKKRLEGLIPRPVQLRDSLSRPEVGMLSFLKELWTTARAGKGLVANEYVSFSTCLGGYETLGNKLFIRACYLKMRELIANDFKLDPETLKGKDTTQGCHQVILTGTPGIGKSCFAYFLLLQLLRPGEEVVYQIGSEYWYFDGEAWSLLMDGSVAQRFLQTFRHWYICDLLKKQGNYSISRTAKTIIISSPKYGMFKAIVNAGSAKRYFLPLWSDEEMSLFIKMQSERGMDPDEVQKIVEDWGNVPRNIVVKPLETLGQAVGGIDSVTSLKNKMDAAVNDDLGMPSKLIHLSPSTDFRSFTARICSTKAEKMIFETLVKRDWDHVVDFAFSSPTYGYQSAAGVAFEHVAHEVLKGGGMYHLQRLDKDTGDGNGSEKLKLKESQPYIEFASSIGDLEEWVIMPDAYCKPKASNFPCMDAMLLSASGVLYMFQMTRAGKHPIKVDSLLNILNALRAKNKFERQLFVFVVPSGHEEMPCWGRDQGFTSQGVKASQEQESQIRGVTQYIMMLSKEDAMRRPKGWMSFAPQHT